MDNMTSAYVLLMKPKEQRKPTKNEKMKKVFIIKSKPTKK